MQDKERCQSCGMPLGEGFYGSESDGSITHVYCKNCYQEGSFTEPDLTMPEMITISIQHMVTVLLIDERQAAHLANSVIPTLKRWQSA